MRTANLGPLSVSAQGLGCMGVSQSYGPGDDAESKVTVLGALEFGITLFDTADVYGTTGAGGFGANETLLGQTLAGRRDEFVLATKCGIQDILPGASVRFALNATPDYIRAACDASLRRLQTDHIDPVLPAPGGSADPAGGQHRRDGRAGRRRQGAPHRGVRGVRRAARGGAPGACDHGCAERILVVDAGY